MVQWEERKRKEYTYKLVIREQYDSFWQNEPSDKEVTQLVEDTLEQGGIFDEDNYAIKLVKYVDVGEQLWHNELKFLTMRLVN